MHICVHWHPQGSYIIRSIVEPALISGIKGIDKLKVTFIIGTSFLKHTERESIDFINSLSNNTEFDVSYIYIDSESNDLNAFNGCFADNSASDQKLLRNSVLDSLTRCLLPNYNYIDFLTCEQPENHSVFTKRLQYAVNLQNRYREILKDIKPDFIVASHATYDFYVSLILAAKQLDIRTHIINGGHRQSYMLKNIKSGKTEDPCLGNVFRLYSDNIYTKQREYKETKNMSSVNTESAVDYIFSNQKRQSQSSDRCLVAFLPIFAEINHHNCLASNFYNTKYLWLRDLIKCAENTNTKLILHLHPDFPKYGKLEEYVLKQLIKSLSKQYTNSSFMISKSTKELMLICENNFTIPVSLSGSITAEMAARGGVSIVSNSCAGIDRIDSTSIYTGNEELDSISKASQIKFQDLQLKGSNSGAALNYAIEQFKKYGKNHSPDSNIKYESDQIFFFGQSKKSNPISNFLELLKVYLYNYEPDIEKLDNFDLYKCKEKKQ